MNSKSKIIAIVVTYQPNHDILGELLRATFPQVDSILIVDNSSPPNLSLLDGFQDIPNVTLISLGDNLGIAYAQNIGIEHCIQNDADYVLLLDQDSVPYPDMVNKLFSHITLLNSHGIKFAAVAPVTVDSRTNFKSYFIVGRYGFPYRYKPSSYSNPYLIIDAGFLISSGSLVSIPVINQVGGKRSNYFIDHVDTEWCFRARSSGYHLAGVHDAFLKHSLGDKVKKFWFLYMRHIPYHSPLRDYYMFRNTIFCVKDTKQNKVWRLLLILRLIQFGLYFLIFAADRFARSRFMIKGIIHGFFAVDGRLDASSGKCVSIPITSIDPR